MILQVGAWCWKPFSGLEQLSFRRLWVWRALVFEACFRTVGSHWWWINWKSWEASHLYLTDPDLQLGEVVGRNICQQGPPHRTGSVMMIGIFNLCKARWKSISRTTARWKSRVLDIPIPISNHGTRKMSSDLCITFGASMDQVAFEDNRLLAVLARLDSVWNLDLWSFYSVYRYLVFFGPKTSQMTEMMVIAMFFLEVRCTKDMSDFPLATNHGNPPSCFSSSFTLESPAVDPVNLLSGLMDSEICITLIPDVWPANVAPHNNWTKQLMDRLMGQSGNLSKEAFRISEIFT